jgi:hypothetical protein
MSDEPDARTTDGIWVRAEEQHLSEVTHPALTTAVTPAPVREESSFNPWVAKARPAHF